MNFMDGAGYLCSEPGDCAQQLPGPAAGGSFAYSFSFTGGLPFDAPFEPITDNWTVSYSGDPFYAPSSASGSNVYPGCPAPDARSATRTGVSSGHALNLSIRPRSSTNNPAASASGQSTKSPDLRIRPAKFALPRISRSGISQSRNLRNAAAAQSCIVSAAGSLSITPSSLVFPSTNLSSTSPAQTLTITNTSNSSLSLAPYTFSGLGASEFKVTGKTCGYTLAVGASCVVAITFTPTAATTPNANFVVTQTTPSNGQFNIPLVATVTEFPTVSFSPTSLTFPATTLGVTSSPMTITITNTSTVTPLSATTFQFTGTNSSQFSLAGETCDSTLAPGASCTASVVYTPNWPGAASAALITTNNSLGASHGIQLSGSTTSARPTVSFSPTSITFPSVLLGKIPPAQTLTVTNTSALPLGVISYKFSGANASEFSIQSKTCLTSLAAGASCTITLAFKPAGVGSASASLIAADDTTGMTQSVPISASITLPPPTIAFSPTPLTFPATNPGATSPAQTLIVINTSTTTPMSVTSYTFSGPNASEFSIQSKTCVTSLPANSSCTLSIIFKPTAAGSVTANLVATDNATGSPQSVLLTGTGN
jgi:hypothetical protein